MLMKHFRFMHFSKILWLVAPALLLISWDKKPKAPANDELQVPVNYYKLPNGLKVVLSPDKTAPTIAVGVYYNIGFRIEPKNRTGFAHLFEHMMFQGSENLGKMEFIQLVQKNGGILNGSTRFDFTNYFEVMPAHKLETALWAEADRMKGLKITQENLTNQQGVVKNEVKVNVLNQPYGGFPWLDMPQYANKNWYNDQYFAKIPASKLPPKPDLTEPPQEKEQRFTKEDALAKKPAIAVSYKMPERNTAEYYAMGLIDQMLGQGQDSKLYQALVQQKGYTSAVSAGINIGLGSMFDYNGPMLWTANLIHDASVPADSIINQFDLAVADVAKNTTPEDLQLA